MTCYDGPKPNSLVEVEGYDLPSYSDYASARDFFDAVYDASREAERTRWTLERMAAREQVRAQSYQPRVSMGGESDKMAQTDARIDYEARMQERIEADYLLLDMACAVIYGNEYGEGGVDSLMGSAVADCMSFRYVDARPWKEVADLTGISEPQCRRNVEMGLDAVDFYGWDYCARGIGVAQT